jgi:hypothetical protein
MLDGTVHNMEYTYIPRGEKCDAHLGPQGKMSPNNEQVSKYLILVR